MVIATLILVQLLFAVNFLASKVIMKSVAVFDWGLTRFIGAFIGIGIIALFSHRKKFPPFTFDFLSKVAGISFLGIVLVQLAFIKGISLSTATDASILSTMIPLFTLLIVITRGEEKLTIKKLFGFLFAFAGVLILQRIENFSFSSDSVVGNSFILFSTFCVGLFFSLSKSFFKKYDPMWSTVFMFFFASLFTLPMTLYSAGHTISLIFGKEIFYYALYSILGGTVFTYFLNNWCLTQTSAAKVSLFVYLQPVLSSILAFFFLGEHIGLRVVISTALIFFGFLLVLEKRSQRVYEG